MGKQGAAELSLAGSVSAPRSCAVVVRDSCGGYVRTEGHSLKINKSALPGWAWDMLAAEERRYRLPEIEVVWRVWRKPWNVQTSGAAFPLRYRIVITAGTDEQDQHLMLLHELGHIVVGPNHGHDARWRSVVDHLWARYGLTEYAAERERVVQLLSSPEFRWLLLS